MKYGVEGVAAAAEGMKWDAKKWEALRLQGNGCWEALCIFGNIIWDLEFENLEISSMAEAWWADAYIFPATKRVLI